MSEPNPNFSNAGGGQVPAGTYTYPNGVTKYIPYPYVPGQTPTSTDPVTGETVPANPGFLEDKPSTPGVTTDNTSNDGAPPGGLDYNPVLGPNTQNIPALDD